MSFTVDLTKWVAKAKGNVDKVLRETVVLASQQIVQRSPVDTGRFRANWQFSVGAPDLTTSDRVDPSGSLTIARILGQVAGIKAGPTVYLTNSLPYAHRLEYEGWSDQAPQGMVRVTLAGLQASVNDYASRLK